ncbi:MAG: VIT1/CCC1 transporter family protein [Verrucomicrobiales bacterium]
MKHTEQHRTHRIGWLRAAVLGANDGIVSTASLVVGVAAAEANRGNIVIAGVAGLVAGAMSMAAGEYVSVSSQSDTEAADLDRERGSWRMTGSSRSLSWPKSMKSEDLRPSCPAKSQGSLCGTMP